MFKYTDAFTNRSGDALPGYYARLFDADGNQVDIFADANETPISTVSGVANAALSDENGMFRWYVVNGAYDIVFSDANDVFVSREVGVPMFEASGVYTDLSADGGAALVGSSGGDTVQEALDARPTTSDLAASGASAGVGYINGNAGASARTVQAALRDFGVNVADFGANPANPDNKAAIQAALASGAKRVYIPSGSYYCDISGGPLTTSTDQQQIIGFGDVNIFRVGNGSLFTSSAADLNIENISFWGQTAAESYTGDLVVLSGVRAQLIHCACRDAGADKGLWMKASLCRMQGERDGYYCHVVIGESGSVCLYPRIENVYIQDSLTMVETGAGMVVSGVMNDVTILAGSGIIPGANGPKISGTRIVGTFTVEHTSTVVCGGTSCSGNVIVGNGTDAISGISFDTTFVQGAGHSFTINANVVQSRFFLQAVVDAGNTLTVNSPINEIWHGPIANTPTLTAFGGSPTVGNGTLTGTYSREGLLVTRSFIFDRGSTTNFGTAEMRLSLPVAAGAGRNAYGSGIILDSGTGFLTLATKVASSGTYLTLYAPASGGDPAGSAICETVPITFATGDRIEGQVTYSVK